MFQFLKNLLGRKPTSRIFTDDELITVGSCPNCWGYQDYDGQYKEYVADKTKANTNKDKTNQKAFINQFVETNITGIRLRKDGDQQVCPKCKTKYKSVSSKAS